ncbi:putative eukaryotic translation initiation factor 3 subunit CLU1/TIF31 [Hortaea werneckii]|nr:putative eukaryotic translation initiation factor 3 subunit CLU1/TIF31 [Hortaea werneckii]
MLKAKASSRKGLCRRLLLPPLRVSSALLRRRLLATLTVDVLDDLVQAPLVHATGQAVVSRGPHALNATASTRTRSGWGRWSRSANSHALTPAASSHEEFPVLQKSSRGLLSLLGLVDGAVRKSLEPSLRFLGVLVLRSELLTEDVVTLLHLLHSLAGVVVKRERLRVLEEQRRSVDGVLARDVLANLERRLEPHPALLELLERLQHNCGIHSVARVSKCGTSVASSVLHQAEVEVGEDGLTVVNAERPLRHDDRLLCQLNSRVLLIKAVVKSAQSVVDTCDLWVQDPILLVLLNAHAASIKSLFRQNASRRGFLDDRHNVEHIVCVERLHRESRRRSGSLPRLRGLEAVLAELVLLGLKLEANLEADFTQHLHFLALLHKVVCQVISVAQRNLPLQLRSQSLWRHLLKAEVFALIELLQLLVDLGDGLAIHFGA